MTCWWCVKRLDNLHIKFPTNNNETLISGGFVSAPTPPCLARGDRQNLLTRKGKCCLLEERHTHTRTHSIRRRRRRHRSRGRPCRLGWSGIWKGRNGNQMWVFLSVFPQLTILRSNIKNLRLCVCSLENRAKQTEQILPSGFSYFPRVSISRKMREGKKDHQTPGWGVTV